MYLLILNFFFTSSMLVGQNRIHSAHHSYQQHLVYFGFPRLSSLPLIRGELFFICEVQDLNLSDGDPKKLKKNTVG